MRARKRAFNTPRRKSQIGIAYSLVSVCFNKKRKEAKMSLFKRKPWTGKTELLFSDKALTALILPLFLEQLLSVFVGLSDSIMVAQVGEAAVSAVSLVDSIAILLINIFNALATGGAVVSGQYLGAKDKKKAAYAGRQMMQFMVWMSIAIMLLIYLGKYFISLCLLFHLPTPLLSPQMYVPALPRPPSEAPDSR